MRAHDLFVAAAILMLIDAVAYSLGALRPLHKALAPRDPYLSQRLLLNLMLANAGLYFSAMFAFVGAFAAPPSATGIAVMAVALAACLYSVLTVLFLTPRDWGHSIPRALAAMAIIVGLVV